MHGWSRLALKRKIQLAFTFVSLVTVSIFTTQAVIAARDGALNTIDEKLLLAARSYVYILGEHYHDQLTPRNEADLAAKRREAERLTQAQAYLGVDYLYSFVKQGGKFFYSQSSLSDAQMKDAAAELYLSANDVPTLEPFLERALSENKPQFQTAEQEGYGKLRTVALPVTSPKGNRYFAMADLKAEVVEAAVRDAMTATLISGGLMLALATVISILLGNMIARPLQRLSDVMRSLTTGSGDLTVRLPVESGDETGQIAQHFNSFMSQLRDMFLSVRNEAESLASGVDKINQMTNRIARDADTQSEMAASTAATIEQLTVSINHVADNTRDADAAARQAGTDSLDSAKAISALAEEIGQVAGAVSALSGVMSQLDGRSREISTIVGVIKEIADQTNLLALNAAIEAARAGEQGRGFAVVADEVRKLAERTGRATIEIGEMIEGMRRDSGEAMGQMDATHRAVQGGASQADMAAQQIGKISDEAQDVVVRMQEIALSATEQSSAANQMAQSAERMSVMAQEGSVTIAEARVVIEDLNRLSGELRGMIDRFKL